MKNMRKGPVQISLNDLIMIGQESKQIIALWVGKQAQQCAFSFYHLQAEQIFDQQQDPIEQSAIWASTKKMQPRAMIMDTQIQRLAVVREVSNKKILQKMKNENNWNSVMNMFGQVDSKRLQQHPQAPEKQWPEHTNWSDKQSTYFKINSSYTALPNSTREKQTYSADLEWQRWQTYDQFYVRNRDQCENGLRRQLERTDYLKVFSLCADENYNGYTAKMVEYLREECPKKMFVLTSLTENNFMPILSLSRMYDQIDLLLPLEIKAQKYPYFSNATPSQHLAPLLSSLLTPLVMKNVDPYSYIASIIEDNRKLFNTAYCMPAIGQDLNLHKPTSIFRYEEAAWRQANPQKQHDLYGFNKEEKGSKKVQEQDEIEKQDIRIEFTNSSYLAIGKKQQRGRFVSESYILKGQFNDFEKTLKPKAQPSSLSVKFLKGIFSVTETTQLQFDKYYQHWYDKAVQVYPYHAVMFSHETFGDNIRSILAKSTKQCKIFNEEWAESKEKVLAIADSYCQEQVIDDE